MDRLVEIIKNVNPVILETDKKIISDGLMDSVDLVGIISEIEEAFGIEIPMDEISPENFNDIESMWVLIQKLQ